MIKAVLTFRKRADLSLDDFLSYWLNEHPKAVLKLPGLLRYVQDHPLKNGYAKRALPVDGFAETWWPDVETMRANTTTQVWQDLVADEERFIDRTSMQTLLVDEHVMKDEPVAADGFKIIEIVPRKKGMSVEDYRHHWRFVHGPMGATIPAVRRYVQNHPRMGAYRDGRQPHCDGYAMVWFNSMADMRNSPQSPEYQSTVADEPNFIDSPNLDFVICKEHVIRG